MQVDIKKLVLINIKDSLIGELPNLISVRYLKRREAANIKRLQETRYIHRHIETNNLVLYTVLVKLRRSIATIAIKDKQIIDSYYIRRYISIKVLQLLKSKLISRLAIITQRNYLVSRQTIILARLVELSRQDNKGQDRPARRINSFNYRYLVVIARLYSNCSTNSVRAYNNL